MINLKLLIIFCLFQIFVKCFPDWDEIIAKQEILSKLIYDILETHNYHGSNISDIKRANYLVPIPPQKSSYHHLCDRLQYNHLHDYDLDRFSCCAPVEVRHLYNVMIDDGKIIYYNANDAKRGHNLPQIKSMKYQKAHFFHMDVDERNEEFDVGKCMYYFNGTLHVVGRGTVKNVYHSIADNFIPIVTQIFEDYLLDPELLYLPRAQLTGFQPDDPSAVPHIKMIDRLMAAGSLNVHDTKRVCFRRIVWGHGPHIMYHDVNVHIRRVISDFIRKFVGTMYSIPVPEPFRAIHGGHKKSQEINTVANGDDEEPLPESHFYNNTNERRLSMQGLLLIDGHPMRLSLYTRGDSGRGRTMKGENMLIEALKKLGVVATICCNFESTSMEEQIGYAYHADAIIGLHGAAMAHAIFAHRGIITLELKTLYGYTSTLFGLISDARMGTHSQVDVRDYFIVGGHKPVDGKLIERVLEVLREAVTFRHQQYQKLESTKGKESIEEIRALSKPGDFIMNYANDVPQLRHILGPKSKDVKKLCSQMIYNRIRKQLNADEEDHCATCQELKP